MKLKAKLIIVMSATVLMNILSFLLGSQPSDSIALPVFTGLILLLTPTITCVLAGILAARDVTRHFWLVFLPALVNAAVNSLITGFQAAWLETNLVLGLIPGFLAMGITVLILRRKNR